MRGHAVLTKNNGLRDVRCLQNELTNIHITKKSSGSKWFFGSSASQFEIVMRQYIYQQYGGRRLNYSLFKNIGDGRHIHIGIPNAWCKFLNENGWLVSPIASNFAWYVIVLKEYLRSAFYVCKTIFKMLTLRPIDNIKENYAYLVNLTNANLNY